jgi:hypothetical protein
LLEVRERRMLALVAIKHVRNVFAENLRFPE